MYEEQKQVAMVSVIIAEVAADGDAINEKAQTLVESSALQQYNK